VILPHLSQVWPKHLSNRWSNLPILALGDQDKVAAQFARQLLDLRGVASMVSQNPRGVSVQTQARLREVLLSERGGRGARDGGNEPQEGRIVHHRSRTLPAAWELDEGARGQLWETDVEAFEEGMEVVLWVTCDGTYYIEYSNTGRPQRCLTEASRDAKARWTWHSSLALMLLQLSWLAW
jgi:hypothetical protein